MNLILSNDERSNTRLLLRLNFEYAVDSFCYAPRVTCVPAAGRSIASSNHRSSWQANNGNLWGHVQHAVQNINVALGLGPCQACCSSFAVRGTSSAEEAALQHRMLHPPVARASVPRQSQISPAKLPDLTDEQVDAARAYIVARYCPERPLLSQAAFHGPSGRVKLHDSRAASSRASELSFYDAASDGALCTASVALSAA